MSTNKVPGIGDKRLPTPHISYPRINHLEPFTCRKCNGKRVLYNRPCQMCKGTGKEYIVIPKL